jgi:hypothetical protein
VTVDKYGLALAARIRGVEVKRDDDSDLTHYYTKVVGCYYDTPDDALASAAEALGLQPIPLYTAEQVEEAVCTVVFAYRFGDECAIPLGEVPRMVNLVTQRLTGRE